MATLKRKKITLQMTTSQTYSGINIVDIGFQSPDESHTEGPLYKTEYVFHYVVGGEGSYTINGHTYPLTEGVIFLLPKNVLLSYHANRENPYSYWWLGFDGEFAAKLVQQIGLSADNPIMKIDNKRLPFLFQSIFTCIKKNSIVSITRATGYLYELFSLLLSVREENNQKVRTKNPQYIKKAMAYMNHHYAESITIADIAKQIGLNRMYFCTLFKKEIGVSPYQYLAKLRLENARKMLMNSDLTITEVAIQCGFNSINTFSDSFKANTGWSPQQFRKAKQRTLEENRPELKHGKADKKDNKEE